jgi:D-glycero-D-manno-heptose 1,7-bisphosphate phosphatase
MTTRQPAVFFDRDGTLNEEVEFLTAPEQLRLIPGAGRAVRAVNENGFLALVISNQSGIARGLFTEADLIPIHAKFQQELGASGGRIDRIYYCPHHPTAGIPPYRVDCNCRKPHPGMLRRAEEEMGADLSRSYVIGDRVVDVLAGRNAGARGILVLTGYGASSVGECREQGVVPDYIAASVNEAVNFILNDRKGVPIKNA